MNKKPDVWMPFYIADYLADTADLSNAEHGAYLMLLCQAWMNGGIVPLDESRLARLARMSPGEWEVSREVIMRFWTRTESGFMQKRLSAELTKAKNIQNQRSRAGTDSANKRWGNGKHNKRVTKLVTGA